MRISTRQWCCTTTPGLINVREDKKQLFGAGLNVGDKIEVALSLSSFFFTDCNLAAEDKSMTEDAELVTHRVDWTVEILIASVEEASPTTTGRVKLGAAPIVAPDPPLGVFTDADKNDPAGRGWEKAPNTVEFTPFQD